MTQTARGLLPPDVNAAELAAGREDLAAAREEQTANKGPFFFKLPEEACSCTQ